MVDETSASPAACSSWDNAECSGTPYCQPRCPRFFDREDEAILITPFEEADFEPLVSMYEALDGENRTAMLPPRTQEKLVRWVEDLTESGWNLVARVDSQVVGHVGVSPASANDPEFVIFIADEYQGRGIGTELIKQLIAYAGAREHDALQLSVERSNSRAISVYENVDFDVAEEKFSTIRMQLSLEESIAETVQQPPAER